jgi:hypothetical protein
MEGPHRYVEDVRKGDKTIIQINRDKKKIAMREGGGRFILRILNKLR